MKKILYQHIPKTGGQTLALRIASALPFGRSSIMGTDLTYPEGESTLDELLVNYDFIERHINGPVLQKRKNYDIIVTIRDPIKQIASNYLHILRNPLSNLYRAANLLSPNKFFNEFGDFLANAQSRYFISAYSHHEQEKNQIENWTKLILEHINIPRWIVPTEKINEFCFLWQLECKLTMQISEAVVNVRPDNIDKAHEIERIVQNIPSLYTLDALLWELSNNRYEKYKDIVFNKSLSNKYPNNWGCVWQNNNSGIWLGKGWHPPEHTDYGNVFWAGPKTKSEIRIKRRSEETLKFSIIVFCGVYEHELSFITENGVKIEYKFQRINVNIVDYFLDLSMLSNEETIYLIVPHCCSPIMVDNETIDISRKSVAVCMWELQ